MENNEMEPTDNRPEFPLEALANLVGFARELSPENEIEILLALAALALMSASNPAAPALTPERATQLADRLCGIILDVKMLAIRFEAAGAACNLASNIAPSVEIVMPPRTMAREGNPVAPPPTP